MKRFLVDATLIAILVIVGSSWKNDTASSVDEQIQQFEQADVIPWDTTKQAKSFYEIEENKSSSFALSMSNLIVEGVRVGTIAVTDFFTALLV